LWDALLRETGRGFFADLGASLSSAVRDLLGGTARRLVLAAAGVAALLVGVIFLLVAGAAALREASVPASLSYLAMGLVGAVAGLALAKLR
ncbi:MAG TPA: hypothetical protein VEJ18_14800, partial [Planctomycetota bacterium]|nr:hypothetical protein [Planctomycetota bacterium]